MSSITTISNWGSIREEAIRLATDTSKTATEAAAEASRYLAQHGAPDIEHTLANPELLLDVSEEVASIIADLNRIQFQREQADTQFCS